jgi:hypothetical protein
MATEMLILIVFNAYALTDAIEWEGRCCGLVVRIPGYRSRGSGSIPGEIS